MKNLASVVGQIISFELTAGTTVRLMTRFSYKVVQSAASWNSCIQLDESSLQELNFWQQNISSLNKQQIWRHNKIPSQIVYSDTSNRACGAILQIDGIKKTFHRNWSESEQQQSSTWREWTAVCHAVEAVKPDLQSRTVSWFTDNQSIVSIISNGSKVENLQFLALNLFMICIESNISIDVKWIPREANSDADTISKIIDYDDYSLNDSIYSRLNAKWGLFTIDRFACTYNKKTKRFNSRFYQPECESVDAFTQNWHNENNWLFPPPILISRVIAHMKTCAAEGTLVVPFWKSSVFWTIPCQDGIHFNQWVHDWELLRNHNKNLIIRGKAKNAYFCTKNRELKIVLLRISFRRTPSLWYSTVKFCISTEGVCSHYRKC